MKYSTLKAFTIIEVVTVISILSIIAAIGIPTYNKSVEKAKSRRAQENIMTIHSGFQIHKARNGNYDVGELSLDNLNEVNVALNLSIVDTNFDYFVIIIAPYELGVTIRVTRTDGNYRWQMNMELITNLNPTCIDLAGTCP